MAADIRESDMVAEHVIMGVMAVDLIMIMADFQVISTPKTLPFVKCRSMRSPAATLID